MQQCWLLEVNLHSYSSTEFCNCVYLYLWIGQFSGTCAGKHHFPEVTDLHDKLWQPSTTILKTTTYGPCAQQSYFSLFLGLHQINKHNFYSQSGLWKLSVPSEMTVTGHFPGLFPQITLCFSSEFWIIAVHWKHQKKHKLSFMPRLCIMSLRLKQFKPEYSGLKLSR